MIVGITGHRNLGGWNYPNPVYNYVYKEIINNFKDLNPKYIITGMALGTDQLAAVIAIRLGISFVAAVPFKDQEKAWPEKSQKQYNKILNKAKDIIIVSEGDYASWKLQKRNEYIVDNCDILLAVYSGSKSGTGNCVDYAVKKYKKIIVINPNEYKE